jgi:signal transduction histidine kinase/ActR/RegA family two-component response regulator
MVPDEADGWVDIYRKVLLTGDRVRFERELVATGRHLDLAAFRIEPAGRRQVAVLFRDITERKRTENALRASEEQLREADRRKDEFLAMLAHELRNPLAPVRTGLELIRAAGNTPASVDRVRSMMERQIGHMVRLIDDLLDVSRITSSKIQLRREPTPLTSIVNSAVDANRAAIESKNIRLELDLPDTVLVVNVDPTRFVQVVSNLLHNAMKFTEPGGSIRVSARTRAPQEAEAPMVQLSVRDTGIGISAALLPQVFELFTQGEASSSQPGLGIGLALARRLVDMQGGRIEACSDGPGHGSEFVIEMPLSGEPAPVHAPPIRENGALRARVVTIDDNRDAADITTMLVETLGGDAWTACDGETGLQLVLQYRPDVVLLDIEMPGVDGYETCRRIRRELGESVVIAAITGLGRELDKERAAAAGFNAHLTKPADPVAVERVLRQARPRLGPAFRVQ